MFPILKSPRNSITEKIRNAALQMAKNGALRQFATITVTLIFACDTVMAREKSDESAADSAASGELFKVEVLTPDEEAALREIEEKKVLETVELLASDQMAGRDTPSPELTKSSEYVADRFRAAGLTGVPQSDLYLQTTEIPVIDVKGCDVELTFGDSSVEGVRLIIPGSESVELNANGLRPETAAPTSETAASEQSSSIVWIEEPAMPPGLPRSAASILDNLLRNCRTHASNGAKAILVTPSAETRLLVVAEKLMSSAMLRSKEQRQWGCPILLLPKALPTSEIEKGVNVRLRVSAPSKRTAPVSNVVGVLRGSDEALSKQAVIVSAHLDHIGTNISGQSDTINDDRINNGADDNASGVTGVIMLAEAYAALRERPARTMMFVTFWGEEKGLLGSDEFVRNPVWPLDQIVANVNLEMIGRPESGAEGRMWETGWQHSTLGPILGAGAERVGVTVFQHPQFSDLLYSRSDNASFVRAGVIGHSISAGSLHSDYHQPTDEVTKLNIPHMTRVIRGLFAGTLPMAQGVATPEKLKAD
ncbi:MAG: M28 family peptidase [Planctomyces sp.]|jgi:hypothetical protein